MNWDVPIDYAMRKMDYLQNEAPNWAIALTAINLSIPGFVLWYFTTGWLAWLGVAWAVMNLAPIVGWVLDL